MTSWRTYVALQLGLVVAATASLPRPAEACAVEYPAPLELDPDEQMIDVMPPGAVGIVSVGVSRESGSSDGCAARFEIHLGPVTDDRTRPDNIGYLLESDFGGALLVVGVDLDDTAVLARESTIRLGWADRDPGQPIEFDLSVAAVDLAGNVGPTSEPFHVYDGGVGCLGCAAGRAAPRGLGVWLFAAGVAALAVRRRGRA